MNDRRVPSSDLELARSLSRRLRAPRGDAPSKHVEPSPRYVRFEARRAAPESVFNQFASPGKLRVWMTILPRPSTRVTKPSPPKRLEKIPPASCSLSFICGS